MDPVNSILGNESERYGIEIANTMKNWRALKYFSLVQEVEYQLKYRPNNVDFFVAKQSALNQLKKLRRG